MNILVQAALQIAGKELSPYQLGHLRAHSMRIASSAAESVQRGTDTDAVITQPIGVINFLKRHKALPSDVWVGSISHPDRPYMVRSALFGIAYSDLYERKEQIVLTLDSKDKKCQFSANTGEGYFQVLEQMVALASSDDTQRELNKDYICELVDQTLADPVLCAAIRRLDKVAPLMLTESLQERHFDL
jgi:hypothetical protein